jgi:hypothetical protein
LVVKKPVNVTGLCVLSRIFTDSFVRGSSIWLKFMAGCMEAWQEARKALEPSGAGRTCCSGANDAGNVESPQFLRHCLESRRHVADRPAVRIPDLFESDADAL